MSTCDHDGRCWQIGGLYRCCYSLQPPTSHRDPLLTGSLGSSYQYGTSHKGETREKGAGRPNTSGSLYSMHQTTALRGITELTIISPY